MRYFAEAGFEADSGTALMWSELNHLHLLLDALLAPSVLFYQSRPQFYMTQVNKQKVSLRTSYKVAVMK